MLRSAAISGGGIDALDAILDAVAQIGKHDGAVGDRDAIDRECRVVAVAGGRRGLASDGIGCALRSRSSGTFSTGRSMASSVIFGLARPQARQGDVGLQAVDGQAVAAVAVFRVLQRDVVQGHVAATARRRSGSCRRSSAGSRSRARPAPGSPRSGSRRESRSPAAARSTTITAATAAPTIFKALMTTFQTGKRHRWRRRVSGRGRWLKLIPE